MLENVNIYGKWRLHEKLIPEWLAKTREPGTITHILEKDYYDEVKEEVHRNTEDDDTVEVAEIILCVVLACLLCSFFSLTFLKNL